MIGRPLQIVVADDSAAIRSIFASLPPAQYAVRSLARTRLELERAVDGQEFDVLLCGDSLSGPLGGIDAIRRLQLSRKLKSRTALLLMVDNASKEHLLACTQVKPDGILLKPFSLNTLTSRLDRAVVGRQEIDYLRELEEQSAWDELLVQARHHGGVARTWHHQSAQFELKALEQLGRDAEVSELLAQVIERSPGLLWAEETLARRELAAGDWVAAECRLGRLVEQHSSHVAAQELLYQYKRDQGDLPSAQKHLGCLARYTGDVSRRRELGHLAVLTGDIDSAVRAYGSVLHTAETGASIGDQLNFMRAVLLKADINTAGQALNRHRIGGGREHILDIMEAFIQSARSKSFGDLGQAQADVFEGLRGMDAVAAAAVPDELKILAVEQCLATNLTYQATERSRAMLCSISRPLPEFQAEWLFRLHDWAREQPDDRLLPRGMRLLRLATV